jgi:peptidoglycan/xylan/chitin deacetylase (PgdA/CDA1 family)
MIDRSSPHRGCGLPSSLDRRAFIVTLAAGTIASLQACGGRQSQTVSGTGAPGAATASQSSSMAPPPPLPPIPPAHPGKARVVSHAPVPSQQIALTIDDGYCDECVAGYVAFAERTGIPITFSPNGTYGQIWGPKVDRLAPLIARGQIQIGNHTWSHPDLTKLSETKIRDELNRNEDWIQKTFGITARPWFRPPYGKRNATSDGIAGSLGYTNIVLWNASLGDSTEITREQLLANAQQYLQPGNIVLGHANHSTVLELFDRLQQLLEERKLQPVTLDTMYNTNRATG